MGQLNSSADERSFDGGAFAPASIGLLIAGGWPCFRFSGGRSAGPGLVRSTVTCRELRLGELEAELPASFRQTWQSPFLAHAFSDGVPGRITKLNLDPLFFIDVNIYLISLSSYVFCGTSGVCHYAGEADVKQDGLVENASYFLYENLQTD